MSGKRKAAAFRFLMFETVTLHCSYPLCEAPVWVEGAGYELSPYFPGRSLEGNLRRCPKFSEGSYNRHLEGEVFQQEEDQLRRAVLQIQKAVTETELRIEQ